MWLTFNCAFSKLVLSSSNSIFLSVYFCCSNFASLSKFIFFLSKSLFAKLIFESCSIRCFYSLRFFLTWSTFSWNAERYRSRYSRFVADIDSFLVKVSCNRSSSSTSFETMKAEDWSSKFWLWSFKCWELCEFERAGTSFSSISWLMVWFFDFVFSLDWSSIILLSPGLSWDENLPARPLLGYRLGEFCM